MLVVWSQGFRQDEVLPMLRKLQMRELREGLSALQVWAMMLAGRYHSGCCHICIVCIAAKPADQPNSLHACLILLLTDQEFAGQVPG